MRKVYLNRNDFKKKEAFEKVLESLEIPKGLWGQTFFVCFECKKPILYSMNGRYIAY